MQGFRDVFVAGLRTTLRNWRAMLPLFIVGFALGLVQTWPLLGAAAGGALSNPLIRRLASGGSQSAIDLFLSNPGTISAGAGLWALGTFVFTLLFGAAYNFFAGGILNTYLGISARSFWAACRRTFWSFTGLGLLLVVLAPLLIAVGAALGGWLGWSGALVATLVLLQLANMLGEYARALAVARDRRNPFVLLGQAGRFCARHLAGTLALALLGVLLQLALLMLYQVVAGALGGSPLAIVGQQLVVLAWLWVKLLRLAWAAAYVRAAETEPMGALDMYATIQ